ncbi:hypothetical protein GO730_04425 [Spirosoma sp. HMF3257]|uniref:hypothetical protein n=1 Tax=Spirosoma telluris TaxID=2183553 RepID=UPI0011B945A9|nr:hypothetical protein [Spirosoma telluris]
MRLAPKIFRFGPGRYCYTLPVSATGSLWSGFGGWHYRACSFSLIESTRRRSRLSPTACQVIQPGVDFMTSNTRPIVLHLQTLI